MQVIFGIPNSDIAGGEYTQHTGALWQVNAIGWHNGEMLNGSSGNASIFSTVKIDLGHGMASYFEVNFQA
ncbi:hypothetical protein NBRC116598_21570 [Pseudophaeobacter arcticus]|uniref:Uncharacterized protein n=1 Tax=Pseudophaeobacter arcticus TaxID=385492 RepID=A0ABQ0ALG0_9RHOB